MNLKIPTAHEAKRLRAQLPEQGTPVGHAQSLELVAHEHGFRDWNGLVAAIGKNAPEGWTPGGRVSGRYLSHPFEAAIVAVEMVRPGWFNLTLDLDKAVDVVTSEAFSNYRKRIRGVVGPRGHTVERTSNGIPHLQIDP